MEADISEVVISVSQVNCLTNQNDSGIYSKVREDKNE